MTVRDGPRPPHHDPSHADSLPELLSQRKRPESGRYRLEVDRQLKGSFQTFEAAQTAGLAIKTSHPIVRVAVYDVLEGINTAIELPTA
jgi:hypothetical protein